MTSQKAPKSARISPKISGNFHGGKTAIWRVQKSDSEFIRLDTDTRKNRIRPVVFMLLLDRSEAVKRKLQICMNAFLWQKLYLKKISIMKKSAKNTTLVHVWSYLTALTGNICSIPFSLIRWHLKAYFFFCISTPVSKYSTATLPSMLLRT